MNTYIGAVGKDTYTVTEYSDKTADVYVWRGKKQIWEHLGDFPDIKSAAAFATRVAAV